MTESLCRRCAALGGTCCRGTQVFVTCGDVERIAAVTGSGDFWEMASADDGEFAAGRVLDSVWGRVFGVDGRRRVLRHGVGRGCFFLTPDGCSLSLAVRPLLCRLYPFDYNETTIKGVYGPLCPEPERGNGALLLASLAMNRDVAEEWRCALYEEIRREFPDRRP